VSTRHGIDFGKKRAHEQLEVYRLAHELGVRVHKMSLKLPTFERYEEASQIRRSSKSVSAQIVEGHALRNYKSEYIHYLARAYASAEETLEHLRFLVDTGAAKLVNQDEACLELIAKYEVLCRKLFNYTESVFAKHNSSRITSSDP
jgi:four helix bundle protein